MMATKTYTRKRLLALFMAFVMIFGLLPTNVLAEGPENLVEVAVGEWADLENVASSDGKDEWSVKDSSILKVEDGRVYGLAEGETTVYHTYEVLEEVEPVEITAALPSLE